METPAVETTLATQETPLDGPPATPQSFWSGLFHDLEPRPPSSRSRYRGHNRASSERCHSNQNEGRSCKRRVPRVGGEQPARGRRPRDRENHARSGTDSGGDSAASTAFLDHDVKNNVAKVGKNNVARPVKRYQIERYDVVRRTARGESTARQRLGFYGQGFCGHTEAR